MTDNFYLFKKFLHVGSVRHVIDPAERPPYPIVMEKPTPRDVQANMRLGEYMPFFISLPVGAFLAQYLTFDLKHYPLTRRRAFTGVWGTTVVFAYWLGYKGSYYKLTGFEDNGLQWKTPERYIKKYQFTSEMKAGTWERMLKPDDKDGAKAF